MFQLTAARRRLAVSKEPKRNNLNVSTHSRPKAAGTTPAKSGRAWAFQLTAARRRLGAYSVPTSVISAFQLTAARRRLGLGTVGWHSYLQFQLTAARRRLEKYEAVVGHRDVSTHSRPKAAGSGTLIIQLGISPFQLTAARRRLVKFRDGWLRPCRVSTHSRPKAAGNQPIKCISLFLVSTHSRPKAAGYET